MHAFFKNIHNIVAAGYKLASEIQPYGLDFRLISYIQNCI